MVYGSIGVAAVVGVHTYVAYQSFVTRNKLVIPTPIGTGATGPVDCEFKDNEVSGDDCLQLTNKHRNLYLFLGIAAIVSAVIIIGVYVGAMIQNHRHNRDNKVHPRRMYTGAEAFKYLGRDKSKVKSVEEHHRSHTNTSGLWTVVFLLMTISAGLVLFLGIHIAELFPTSDEYVEDAIDIAIAGGVYLLVILILLFIQAFTQHRAREWLINRAELKDKKETELSMMGKSDAGKSDAGKPQMVPTMMASETMMTPATMTSGMTDKMQSSAAQQTGVTKKMMDEWTKILSDLKSDVDKINAKLEGFDPKQISKLEGIIEGMKIQK